MCHMFVPDSEHEVQALQANLTDGFQDFLCTLKLQLYSHDITHFKSIPFTVQAQGIVH